MPSFILITQMWWIRREQSYRTVAYQISNSFAAIFGPLLSYAIGKATEGGKILEYQGIFLFIGSISLAFVPLVAWMMPNSPATAKFLRGNNGRDRLIAIDRLRENNTGTKSSKFKWSQAKDAWKDPKTWMWTAMWLGKSPLSTRPKLSSLAPRPSTTMAFLPLLLSLLVSESPIHFRPFLPFVRQHLLHLNQCLLSAPLRLLSDIQLLQSPVEALAHSVVLLPR